MSHDDSAAAIYQLVTGQGAAAPQESAKPRRSIWAEDLRTAEAEARLRPAAEHTHDRTRERGR